VLKHKVAQNVIISLGYIIFSKNHNEPSKEAQLARNCPICGLYYKTITIVIMTIVSDAPNCGITYDRN
jgi:hypothetical protein